VSTNVTPIDVHADTWRRHLLTNDKDKIVKSSANVVCMLDRAPEWRRVLVYNSFTDQIETVRPPPWRDEKGVAIGAWREEDDARLVFHVEREFGFSLTASQVHAAASNVARRVVVNPVADWLKSLRWDATKRVDTWASAYLGAEATSYTSSVGRWLLVSAVARAMTPGCKVDTVTVLEGPQGQLKSSAVKALFSPYFADTGLDMRSKDRFESIRGVWCYELAEMDGFKGADAATLKSFLSSATDTYRRPYAKGSSNIDRRCIFVGTTNKDNYLIDETGNRRFMPLRCGTIDLVALARDREQLFAEAYAMHESGTPWWPTGELADACRAEQAERVQGDPWEPLIASWLASRPPSPVTVTDILAGALKLDAAKMDRTAQIRVGKVMSALNTWTRKKAPRAEGQSRGWHYVPVPLVPGATS
jgi:putative DNA primase/helicase